MFKIILQDDHFLAPFNERARDLRILNKPLWLIQRDLLAPYTNKEMEIAPGEPLPMVDGPCLVYRDNLYFDQQYLDAFLTAAGNRKRPSQAAFDLEKDAAFREHAFPLSTSYTKEGELYLAELWYYPNGTNETPEPLVINLNAIEAGYYHVPTYMAYEQGDLVFKVPQRSLIAINSWVHIFIADVVFGLFARGVRFNNSLNNDPFYKLRILARGIYEGQQVLKCSELVRVGRNCIIDPSAIIHGPTTIGDNVIVSAGAVIDNCIIGDNVNVSQGCQLMLSVVGDGTFLPFRAALFMTTLMDNCMVAQNTCLQMCVVGRNTFLGAGSTFTDFNLVPKSILALNGHDQLAPANRPVLGSCVGHNCRLGSGMIVFPARTIESDVVLFASNERRVIDHNVSYEESDHHKLPFAKIHPRLYPRPGEAINKSW